MWIVLLSLVFPLAAPAVAVESSSPDQAVALVQALVEQASAQLPAQAALRVRDLHLPPQWVGRVDPGQIRFQFIRGEDFSGPSVVGVELDGRRRWLKVEFTLQLSTAVARTDLPRGRILEEGDLELCQLPVERLRGFEPATPATLVGQELISNLRTGEPPLPTCLRRPEVVRRGDRVEIEVQGEGLRLTTAGEALATGRVGDTLPVKNLASGKHLSAAVIGPCRVRIGLVPAAPGARP